MTEKATDRLVRLQQRKVALERQIAKAEQEARERGQSIADAWVDGMFKKRDGPS